jgi:hypothetical protein
MKKLLLLQPCEYSQWLRPPRKRASLFILSFNSRYVRPTSLRFLSKEKNIVLAAETKLGVMAKMEIA